VANNRGAKSCVGFFLGVQRDSSTGHKQRRLFDKSSAPDWRLLAIGIVDHDVWNKRGRRPLSMNCQAACPMPAAIPTVPTRHPNLSRYRPLWGRNRHSDFEPEIGSTNESERGSLWADTSMITHGTASAEFPALVTGSGELWTMLASEGAQP
jgi:hypothetical protein